ncbi:putative phage tail protein [Marinicrinis sediminis]|uniref:Phage tail protein n=1 Tax=Marinicrinis sediminis TaxID=1652465 RepID=A0ABW5RB15_9BACL
MRKDKIIGKFHRIDRDDPLINEISGSVGALLDDLDEKVQAIINEFDIDKASSSVLTIYEKELGIKTDLNKSLADRRAVIKGQLRGTGKADSVLIKVTAESWTYGEVEVSFDGHINIQFTSEIGTPSAIEDVKRAIEQIKPAHLRVNYQFRYITYNEVQAISYNELQNLTWDKFARRLI